MTNILVSALPESVEIDGAVVPINADFRAALMTILAFEDPTLSTHEKQIVMLENLYLQPPTNLLAAFERAQWFLNGGKEEPPTESATPRLYSLAKDAPFIFAAFRQTHGIDLQEEQMHWWKFLALFMDLGSETTFCQLLSLRKKVKSGKATKEERAAAREMGDVFDVPETEISSLDELEAEAEFIAKVKQARAKQAAEKSNGSI